MPGQNTTDLLIVGAGFGGLIMAIEARKRGIRDIVILEKADEVGGTWRENTYPGVACDVPSHLYSMASHPNPDWTTAYAGGGEIQAYIQRVAQDEGLYDLCRFKRTFKSAKWDGAQWQIDTEGGERWSAKVFVSALGPLHVPQIPALPGADSFLGPCFHSAQWDHDVDLTGKRVAVVGSGASVIQFVPEIAKTAGRVSVFQRSAPYVIPRPDGPISPIWRTLYRALPFTRQLRRQSIYHMMEMRHGVFMGKEKAVNFAMNLWRKGMERSITDPEMRNALTPDYRIGCKRILSSNAWYKALARDNVDLIPSGVARIDRTRVIAATGESIEADVLIWGTGFQVTDALERLDITGDGGHSLAETWKDGVSAHLGVSVAGFPNLFFLLGPNTGLGHNSVVLMIEAQVEHICRLLDQMKQSGTAAIEPLESAQADFAGEMSDRLSESVWQNGGCASWYQDASGHTPVLWPGTVGEYRKRMRAAGIEQYRPVEIEP
ncbi:flavin-containing monooxygenase [Phaeobacter marinintestinus]|uniref:flavin-containing monooxygenase n=1 Tax=Falsiphaeobacter marinintestinus TaxID=1492905 RepID=UPI0011B763B0|nr:NAD(P)/FAD-dependent oxidoreductase [Phaeobacter marinintestinus]